MIIMMLFILVPISQSFAQTYFSSSFETGNVSEWLADDGGNHQGGGYVTTERALTGKYSWKAYNDPKLSSPDNISAKLLRWRFDYKEAFYSAWYFWPTDYNTKGVDGEYINMFQWKERTSPYDPTWIVAVKPSVSTGKDELVVHDWHGKKIYRTGIAFPKGTWFKLEAFLRAGRTDGQLIVWFNDQEIFRLNQINTLGNTPSYLMWGVGNYGGAGLDKFIYVDDAKVSSQRSTSVAQLSAPTNLRIVP